MAYLDTIDLHARFWSQTKSDQNIDILFYGLTNTCHCSKLEVYKSNDKNLV